MGAVASRPSDKSRKLQVIGAGLCRTGTLSVSLALERLLDGPVMHGGTQLFGREDAYVKLLADIFDQRNPRPRLLKLLREATGGFVAITDTLGHTFVPELLELYPDAKVVLVTRDPDKWLKSMGPLIGAMTSWWLGLLLWPCPGWRWVPAIVRGSMQRAERNPNFVRGDPATARVLLDHNDWVKRVTPPDSLLVMRLDEGWGPLCRFLNKPVPAEPFPHVNDSQALASARNRVFLTSIAAWFGILLAFLGCVLSFVPYVYRWRMSVY